MPIARSRLQSPQTALALVACVYAVLQFAIVDLSMYFEWDEAVYTAEVSRFADAIFLDAHRARGVTFVVAPIAWITDSMLVIRTYLALITSVGLYLGFRPWISSIGYAAPVAASVFGGTWLAVFYGSQVIPNLYSALATVGTVGLAVMFRNGGGRAVVAGMATGASLVTLFRPLDGAMLMGTLVLVLAAFPRRRLIQGLMGAAAGAFLGLVPWLVEGWVRFGGPLDRLDRIREIVGGGVQNGILEYLKLMDGPLSWPDREGVVSILAIVWLGSTLVLGVVGMTSGDRLRRRIAMATMGGGLVLASPYLLLSQAAAPRFMLPAIGLLAVAAAIGLVRSSNLLSSGVWRFAAVLASVVFLFALNVGVLAGVSEQQSIARMGGLQLAEHLVQAAGGEPCFYLSSSGYPQIWVRSGCHGGRFSGDLPNDLAKLTKALADGRRAFVLMNNLDLLEELDRHASCNPIEIISSRNWHLCEVD